MIAKWRLEYKLGLTFIIFLLFAFYLPAETLTLADCISRAKEGNIQLLRVKLEVEKMRGGLTSARSSYYPSLGLSSGYRYGGGEGRSASGSFSTGLNAQYPLYQRGRGDGVKIAQIRVKVAEENYRQKENEILFSTKKAFFRVLQNEEQIRLIEKVRQRREENLYLLRLNYRVGRESETNLKEAEASLAQTEYELMKKERELTLAKSELLSLLNQSDGEIAVRYEKEVVVFPPLETLMVKAHQKRPEAVLLELNQEILRAQIKQAQSGYFPTLSLSSSYGLQGDTFWKPKSNWSIGVNFSLPLFDGLATKAKVREANISFKQNQLDLYGLRKEIELEVREAYTNWQLALKNLEVSEKMLSAVRTAYQLTKLEYEQGRTSYFFLQQKESELTQTENSYLTALYNLWVAIATLEKAIGG